MQFWTLIVDSLRESLDRKILWVIGGISLVVTLAMLCVGFEADAVTILFGKWRFETTLYNPETEFGRGSIAGIAVALMSNIVGKVGVMLALIATAGFFPTFMERGAIDVVLAKPISRPLLFLGKYFASLIFVLIAAILFVVPTFLVMGLWWRTWILGYLLTIPLLVLLFSYLYCISVWVAVAFRSTLSAALLSIGAWLVFFGVQLSSNVIELVPELRRNETIYNVSRVARWCVPKTEDIRFLAERWCRTTTAEEVFSSSEPPDMTGFLFRPEDLVRFERKRRSVSAVGTIGSSLGFEAIILIWAMWKFSREDF